MWRPRPPRPSRRGLRKRSRRRGPALWVDGDRVWSRKQEAPSDSRGSSLKFGDAKFRNYLSGEIEKTIKLLKQKSDE